MKTSEEFVPLLSLDPKDIQGYGISCSINDFNKLDSKEELRVAVTKRKDLISIIIEGYYLDDNDAESIIAAGLKANPNIEELHLDRVVLSEKGIQTITETLKNCKKLKVLRLSHGTINEMSAGLIAEYIKKNAPSLVTLVLTHDSITPKGAEILAGALRENTTLETVVLNDNTIGSVGVTALAEALPRNASLRHLGFKDNSVERNDVCFEKLGNHLTKNKTLCHLDMQHIDKKWLVSIEDVLEKNRVNYRNSVKTVASAKSEKSSGTKVEDLKRKREVHFQLSSSDPNANSASTSATSASPPNKKPAIGSAPLRAAPTHPSAITRRSLDSIHIPKTDSDNHPQNQVLKTTTVGPSTSNPPPTRRASEMPRSKTPQTKEASELQSQTRSKPASHSTTSRPPSPKRQAPKPPKLSAIETVPGGSPITPAFISASTTIISASKTALGPKKKPE